ncbi:hypothetical protein V8G54_013352 [Vigna mungo]|uniref:Integrase catalytic domain-containing protein n=1 Tax=Vigna mungo TaxID=3915 RepID=A0AAQ3NVI7_VIGMU
MQQKDELPNSATTCSRLKMEETTIKERATHQSGSTALLTVDEGFSSQPQHHNRNITSSQGRNNSNQGKKNNRGRGNNNRGGKGGRGGAWAAGAGRGGAPQQQQYQTYPPYQHPFFNPWAGWAQPPCPYPAASWQPRPQCKAGILGSRPPQQAYNASVAPSNVGYTPTDINVAMHSLSLSQPDENWYMDTSATSHMTADQGTLSSYFYSSKDHNIVVGNGHLIPIHGHGSTKLSPPHPPLNLKNVLHAPKLIKNLISVRKFTTDNLVSVEFDPFGFSVKDLQTGNHLMRCNSSGDLYPIPSKDQAISSPTFPSALTVLSPNLWHNRLGHPGPTILSSLCRQNFINCNKGGNDFCTSCPLGKNVKLPFNASCSFTEFPFDIIHSDIWTSPLSSSSGHRYYVLFLDDFSKFLWTFPISKKSQVFSLFQSFKTLIKTQFERDIKNFQCDNGKEFANSQFQKLCQQSGMQFRFSCPHTSP